MMQGNKNLILNDNMNLELLLNAEKKPDLNAQNEELFWDDPHISQQMLKAHLNPDLDAASYNHKTIDQIVEWQVKYLNLREGAKILDLGCGPGLYTSRFAQYGINVVGMDYSRNSIDYAKKFADTNGLNIQYLYQDYLTMDFSCEFDAVFLVYCDFGALSDCKRDLLLHKIYKSLKPDGLFIFDVFTKNKWYQQSSKLNWDQQPKRNWYISESGFWRPTTHLVLEQTFHYEDENVFLDQYIIIDRSGDVATYNLRDHYYSKQNVQQLMKRHGYHIQDIWSDLTGKEYEENTKCLGIAARK